MLVENYDFHVIEERTSKTKKTNGCDNLNTILITIGILVLIVQIALLLHYQKKRYVLILYFSLIDIAIVILGILYFMISRKKIEAERLYDIISNKRYIQDI